MKKIAAAALTIILALSIGAAIPAGAETAIDRENLALETDVEADNSFENNQWFSAAFLTDGVHVPLDEDPHAGWSIDPFSVIPRDEPVNITIDLWRTYILDTIVIRPCLYNNGEKMPSTYEVQISEDGSTWTTVAQVEGLVLTEAEDQIYTFDPAPGRYVRIAITEHSDKVDGTGSYLSEFSEIEVYGEKIPATEAPTEEPTEEPTQEPTAEPTQEPTTPPTSEPVVQPTEKTADNDSSKNGGKTAAIIIGAVLGAAAIAAVALIIAKNSKKKPKQ
ncbi:MAG: discoidin domain-containing protein [Clostridia bacterium]|nr:discoidin domain-containing protein [Clostridia bacterium]